MGLSIWKWIAIVGFNAALFLLGASIWTIKNHGFFKALSLPGNYGEEVSKLSRLREAQNNYYVELGNHQISFSELDWDLFIIGQSLRELENESGFQEKFQVEVENALRKFLLGMVLERKLLYHQVHADASFSVEDPQRYSSCIEEWHRIEGGSLNRFKALSTSRYVKSSLCERSLLQQYIKEKIEGRIHISDEEILRFYEKNRSRFLTPERVIVRHILLSDEPSAQKVRIQLNSKNFADLSQKHSIAPEGAKGGLLGPLIKGKTLPVFERAFFMRIDEISPVVRSDYGYHIVMLQEKLSKGLESKDRVKEIIRRELYAQRRAEEYQSWIEDALAKLPIGSAKIIW
jgi:hypothetical protein